MENTQVATQETGIQQKKKTGVQAISEYLNGSAVAKKFESMMGKRSTAFITSVLHVCANNDLLKNADPASVYQAAAVAATLDLPINNNLGFAYIIPYKEKRTDDQGRDYEVVVAQFQMGYKGFIQLAQRSGQFKYIGASPIYEGQLVQENPLTGNLFDFTKKISDKVIGYASGFVLLNGFDTTFYMSVEKLQAHGKRYSKTYGHKNGRWAIDFESMATKTVIKLLLSKYAPLSVETIQSAIAFDQARINNFEERDVEYVDAVEIGEKDHEAERAKLMIENAGTLDELEMLKDVANQHGQTELFDQRTKELAA
jgi:recombination protein RecT